MTIQIINVVHEYVTRGYKVSFHRSFKTTVVTLSKGGNKSQFNFVGFSLVDFEKGIKETKKRVDKGIVI